MITSSLPGWLAIWALWFGMPGEKLPPDTTQNLPPPTVTAEATTDLAYEIGKLLRCPVCQGMPIAESPASMAQDMMKQVREMVNQGKTRQQILDHFASSYGEWVYLRPKAQGMNTLVWFLPPIVLILGGIVILAYLRRRTPAAAATPASSTPLPDSPSRAEDDYLSAIREEVSE